MSKNKKHKQVTPKIPRDDYVYGITKDIVSSLTLTVDPVAGSFSIAEIDPTTITRKITYKREDKDDKVIYSAPADDFSLFLDHFEQLKTKFDYLLAVDTNTDKKTFFQDGYALSAASIYCIIEPIQTLTNQIPYKHLASYVILDTNIEAKHESLGWHLLIKHHIQTPFLRSQRIGIIVDSELGKHLDINSRQTPYHADFFLPPNVSLIYASSDKPEIFANNMIKHCDTAANMLIKEAERRGLEELIKHGPPETGTAKCFFVKGAR
tara:strand:+ start:1069 stop:1863 length:795 start_codon:yes stop_codon:yes gene_type:complete